MYIHTYGGISLVVNESPPQKVCTPTLVSTSFKYTHACRRPTVRSEACLELSDEGRDCKLFVTHSENCT